MADPVVFPRKSDAHATVEEQERVLAAKLEAADQRRLDRLIRAERRGSWWQGFAVGGIIMGFLVGAGVLASTTALFDPIAKATMQSAVARSMLDKTQ